MMPSISPAILATGSRTMISSEMATTLLTDAAGYRLGECLSAGHR